MQVKSRLLGTVEIDGAKIIRFPKGIIGYPDFRRFALVSEDDAGKGLHWLLSVDEPAFALPVIDPLLVKQGYSPQVAESAVEAVVGGLSEDNLLMLVTVTIPHKIEDISVNLAGPIIINTDTMKGTQVIVENAEYGVKFGVYDILKKTAHA